MLYQLAVAAITSWQMRAIVGLIFLDVLLGIASAIKTGAFQWREVARFYRTNVIPYVLGYVSLYVAIHLILPDGALAGWGNELSDGAVLLAWGALVGALLRSVNAHVDGLYKAPGSASRPDAGGGP